MSGPVEFFLNKASQNEIADHLLRCDADFVPPLSGRVEIRSYAHKITNNATRFEAWAGGALIGMVAAYCNDSERRPAYITSVSVLRGWTGGEVGSRLLGRCIGHLKELGFERIELEVDGENAGAIRLYEKKGFLINRLSGRAAIMHLSTGKDT